MIPDWLSSKEKEMTDLSLAEKIRVIKLNVVLFLKGLNTKIAPERL